MQGKLLYNTPNARILNLKVTNVYSGGNMGKSKLYTRQNSHYHQKSHQKSQMIFTPSQIFFSQSNHSTTVCK